MPRWWATARASATRCSRWTQSVSAMDPTHGKIYLTLNLPETTIKSERTGETQTLIITNLVVGQSVVTHTESATCGGIGVTYSGGSRLAHALDGGAVVGQRIAHDWGPVGREDVGETELEDAAQLFARGLGVL